MAKICILEDSEEDTVSRYSSLTQTPHEVHVVLDEDVLFALGRSYKDRVRAGIATRLSEAGFKPDNVRYGFESVPTDASVYFCDGLQGKCIELAERLGKERVYIQTTSSDLERLAKERGLKVLDRPVKDIVAELQ